jgi:ribosomal protein S18 acetylase RimI-like enzyme
VTGTRRGGADDAHAIAALHAERIADGFLVTLGPRFLDRLYRRMVRSDHAFVVVTDDADGLTGFVGIAKGTGRFYRDFMLRDGLMAVASSAPALVRAPRRVWETLRYGALPDNDLPAAEVLAIAVAARAEGSGLGGELLRAALAQLRRDDIDAVRVVTATDNTAALRMYERVGFRPHGRTEVHTGVVQEVLVWR